MKFREAQPVSGNLKELLELQPGSNVLHHLQVKFALEIQAVK